MRLGRAATYAVLATAHLAEHGNGTPIQGRDIAEACGLPAGHLLKILQQLVRARILGSERGPAGGFFLRKAAGDITLLEVIESLEGPINGDLVLRTATASTEGVRARLEEACHNVANHAKSVLSGTVIADFVSG